MLRRALGVAVRRSSSGGWRNEATRASVLEECSALHVSVVAPSNEALRGPLAQSEHQLFQTVLPFVLLLGNHSSGKSSFANLALGRQIQTAGVAPTDDSFTIIAPGPADYDRDGPAVVSDPDLGFEGLRGFGPNLVQHTQLKIRSGLNTTSFMVVDSPGMIDSPGAATWDRGYDFQGAVRWLAERADVILLFFDPDKPGTTGETLSVLTHALAGTDHKLHIILNKADRFERIHDFARAYGALCWNLSKVIPRKDLPRIYTMCVPQPQRGKGIGGMEDLDRSREEVLAQVFDAPSRRLDNAITRLRDSAVTLLMHAKVSGAARRRAIWRRAAVFATSGAGLLAVAAITTAAPFLAVPAVGVLVVAGTHVLHDRHVSQQLRDQTSDRGLEDIYRSTHPHHDDDATATWERRVKHHLKRVLADVDFDASRLPRHPHVLLQNLKRVIDVDVPALRRQSAPVDFQQVRHAGTTRFPPGSTGAAGKL
ncbi:hypothetical protein CTAYLR_007940 [Chrysophaeum taylorii]|uniref:Dynamin N-terminal domain-containing protein n=1 Tax=Chrysophaeum taylorii TaxID=2483200 RepID=A0AAD7UM83_9STRA|nr:hypothetical protein CTAYLR_007940 [Chrysophaeum taylorii]